ncbi:Fur-regulated basic protein FbpA [Evansella sp. LMS18]|uniref:Fur-regulated basic protein FbpA n=1 Tax=Evansella sp. LMS18 TaxID=2924033 RepID=UPI0020D15A33|nr:Fur-regulated basic protein FbpA [Evansella sp. LMS18]UTR08976.1 Fur-regulated basic protein FbpA [Evansella sp. LMS18]
MSKHIQNAIRARKNYLISQLIQQGIYKKGDQHLYELTLTELEDELSAAVKKCAGSI